MDYHYINKEILKDKEQDERIAYGIDLWETNSKSFLNINSLTNLLLNTRRFKMYTWDNIENDQNNIIDLKNEIFELQAGDLVCRDGNVDFYLSNGKIISWCRVHNTYLLSKNFDVKENGIYSDYQEDKGKIYTTVIRFKGGKDEK